MSFHIPPPNFTQIPNIFFGEVAKSLSEGELRIVLVLMRQTFGWHKQWDRISLSTLAESTGMNRPSVCRSLNSLLKKGHIEKRKFGTIGKQQCYYALIVQEQQKDPLPHDDGYETQEEEEAISNISDQSPKDTGVVSLGDPQKKASKERENYYCAAQPEKPKKQEKTPAAGNNNLSAKKQEKKIYPCLEELDVFAHTKKSITAQHTEEQVQYATQLLTHKDSIYHGKGTKESSMLIQHALQDPQRYKDTIDSLGQPKLTKQQREAKEREIALSEDEQRIEQNYKWVKQSGFINFASYNGWRCTITKDSIGFGAKNSGWSIHYRQKDFMQSLQDHLKSFGIAIPNM